jgi:hypothetical protein
VPASRVSQQACCLLRKPAAPLSSEEEGRQPRSTNRCAPVLRERGGCAHQARIRCGEGRGVAPEGRQVRVCAGTDQRPSQGKGVRRDVDKVAEWYYRLGHADAQSNLGAQGGEEGRAVVPEGRRAGPRAGTLQPRFVLRARAWRALGRGQGRPVVPQGRRAGTRDLTAHPRPVLRARGRGRAQGRGQGRGVVPEGR